MVARSNTALSGQAWLTLACAALHPQLRAVLIFDVQPQLFVEIADRFRLLLKSAIGLEHPVKSYMLGAGTSDDQLWGSWHPSVQYHMPSDTQMPNQHQSETRPLEWQWGWLNQPDRTALAVIPDLASLSPAAARSAIMLMGSEVVHLQRDGQNRTFQPELAWIAACPGDPATIGDLSPHLLDRFTIRLRGAAFAPDPLRPEHLCKLVKNQPSLDGREFLSGQPWMERLCIANDSAWLTSYAARLAEEPGLLDELISYLPAAGRYYSFRRDRGLTCMAMALAYLRSSPRVAGRHVVEAARLMGLAPAKDTSWSTAEAPPDQQTAAGPSDEDSIDPSTRPVEKIPEASSQAHLSKDPSQTLYLEDEGNVVDTREPGALRLPAMARFALRHNTGAIIGTMPANNLIDLSLLKTIVQALKFQPYRRRKLEEQGKQPDSPLIIRPDDLCRHRRASRPPRLLVLLLDHTCLEERPWQDMLLPHLAWAHFERAAVRLIRFGLKGQQALQAHVIRGQRLTAPPILKALEEFQPSSGPATPLAHGLEQALKLLRRELQHGRGAVRHARLVVLSDGRGNVPLAASYSGSIRAFVPVGNKGVEDALQVARQISRFAQLRLEAYVIDPQPGAYANLIDRLAYRLNARIIPLEQDKQS